MATIRFYLNHLKNGSSQVIAAFQNGDDCPTKYTGYNIPSTKSNGELKYWNKATQRVRSHSKANEINKKIGEWESKFEAFISTCNLNDESPDIAKFINTLSGTFKVSYRNISGKVPSLITVINSFLESIKATHKEPTQKIYKTLKTQVQEYEKDRHRSILLTDVNKAFYKDFGSYLIVEEKNINSTIEKKQRNIVTIVNYAVNELKIKLPDFEYRKKQKLKQVKAPKFPLHPAELATLQAYQPESDFHRITLDAFLLACETGLRFSDIIQLRPGHIQTHIADGGIIRFIDLSNIKGAGKNNMPLSDYAQAIVNKYTSSTGRLFNFEHSQSISRALKAICEKAELTRPCEVVKAQGVKVERKILPLHQVISFHMARNTYITRLLSLNVAPSFVQENAGHSDIKMTLAYNRSNDIERWKATLTALNSKN